MFSQWQEGVRVHICTFDYLYYIVSFFSRARMLLRKKKYQENLLTSTDAQLENLEKLTVDIEFAQVELQVLDGLKLGNAALSKVHEILTVDEVERIMDETKESVEKQQEIDAILNGVLSAEDEDDVLAELDRLVDIEAAENKKEDSQIEAGDHLVDLDDRLPDVPFDTLPEVANAKKERSGKSERVALEA